MFKHAITGIILAFFSIQSVASDVIKIRYQHLAKNKSNHNIEVVQRALAITELEYGAFTLEAIDQSLTPNRELRIMEEGDILNVTIKPANERWDKSTTPIKVPIRLGLLSYRLLLINKVDLPRFSRVNTLDELRQLKAGLLHGWKTTDIFKSQNISVVDTHNYQGMFLMLNKQRFDYIPRAIYEIYDELDAQQEILTDIVVEPSIALYIPTETYVYVSSKYPRIAKRLDDGLRKMLANGELKTILHKYYAKDIQRANLKGRKVITIENSYFIKDSLLEDKGLLYVY